MNDTLKITPTPPPRRSFRATCSKRYPRGVMAETEAVLSLCSHVSVIHRTSMSWSMRKSALLQTDLAFSGYNLAECTSSTGFIVRRLVVLTPV